MGISERFKDQVQTTRVDGFFKLQLKDGVPLALLVEFTRDMFPGVSTARTREQSRRAKHAPDPVKTRDGKGQTDKAARDQGCRRELEAIEHSEAR